MFFFPINPGVRQGCVLSPVTFNTVFQSQCKATEGNIKDTIILALDAFISELLDQEVTKTKTKVQELVGLLELVKSIHESDKDMDFTKILTYFSSVVNDSLLLGQEAKRQIGPGGGSWLYLDICEMRRATCQSLNLAPPSQPVRNLAQFSPITLYLLETILPRNPLLRQVVDGSKG